MRRLNDNGRMTARLFAFVIWAAVAASVAFWGLRLLVSSPATPGHAVAVGDGAAVSGDASRLLGSAPKQAATETTVSSPEIGARFRLTGLMAPKARSTSTQGFALISVDGKPPRAYGVGARIDGDLMLQSVSLRTASIGLARGTPAVVLELPPLPPPTTGSLPPAGAGMGVIPPQMPAALPPRAQPVSPPVAPPPKQPGPEAGTSQAQ